MAHLGSRQHASAFSTLEGAVFKDLIQLIIIFDKNIVIYKLLDDTKPMRNPLAFGDCQS